MVEPCGDRCYSATARLPQNRTRSAMAEPASVLELAEHDEVAAVHRHDLPVAPPQRAVGPPTILDEPRLADRDDLMPVDRLGAAARPGDDVDPSWDREAPGAGAHSSNGVSTARRSGTRESGSTASTRSAPSGPATARTWRIASRNRARRGAVPSSTSARPRACGGPKRSTARRSASAGAGSCARRWASTSRIRLASASGSRDNPPSRPATAPPRAPRAALDERRAQHDRPQRAPVALAAGEQAIDEQLERAAELLARRRLL